MTAFLPADPDTTYEATTDNDGTYTIYLPVGVATTGWTVVASGGNGYASKQADINLTDGTATVNFNPTWDEYWYGEMIGWGSDVGGGSSSSGGWSGGGGGGGGDGGGGGGGGSYEPEASASVPIGGMTGYGYIFVNPIDKTATSSSCTAASPYLYEIKVTSDSAGTTAVAASDIKRVDITLPFYLSMVNPGDLESGVCAIYTAETQDALESGGGTRVLAENIISTDYIGYEDIGSVTFRVDHLSWFAIGTESGEAADEKHDGSGCFIATAAYGSYFEKHVKVLRDFRDACLLTNDLGRAFVKFYYRHSPAIANVIAKHGSVRAAVRLGLAPLVGVAYVAVHATPVQKVLVLMFLMGMLAAGAVIIYRTRRARRVVG